MKGNYQRTGIRRELDQKFRDRRLRTLADRPDWGWVREVREALGMTAGQLAVRMGVSQPAVTQLERSEVAGHARLDSLRKAADALGCDLVYALVPRTSLQETLHARAVELATRDLAADARPSDADVHAERIRHIATRLVAGGRIWDERDAG